MNTPNLSRLREIADAAEAAFDAECRAAFADGRWGYYRAMEGVDGGKGLTHAMHKACDAYLVAVHNFYHARDGDRGFLGARGA